MNLAGAVARGFVAHRRPPCFLLARASIAGVLLQSGFAAVAEWERRLASGVSGAGRGARAVCVLPDGTRGVMKRMRRGGLTRPLWRDRFLGAGRLVSNLVVPSVALERGVPTAEPLALLLRRDAPGLFRGWLMTREIEGASDLTLRLRRAGAGEAALDLAAALAALRRMHDAGVDHPDLNLGNLLLRATADGDREAFVIDLDRTRLHPGPLGTGRRRAALRRLERSYCKVCGENGVLGDAPAETWCEAYAAGDPILARRLAAARRPYRLRLALHRATWRLRGKAVDRDRSSESDHGDCSRP